MDLIGLAMIGILWLIGHLLLEHYSKQEDKQPKAEKKPVTWERD